MNKRKFYGNQNDEPAIPTRRRRRATPSRQSRLKPTVSSEPITIELSDDDEEETKPSENNVTCDKTHDDVTTANNDITNGTSAGLTVDTSSDVISTENSESTTTAAVERDVNSDEDVAMTTAHPPDSPSAEIQYPNKELSPCKVMLERLEDDDHDTGEAGMEKINLMNVRSVKLGALRTGAEKGIQFDKTGITMELTPTDDADKKSYHVVLFPRELLHIQVHPGLECPMLAVYVTPACAQRIFYFFIASPVAKGGGFLEPSGQDDQKKRILMLFRGFPDDFISRLRVVCNFYSAGNRNCTSPLLEEIDTAAATRIIRLSTTLYGASSSMNKTGATSSDGTTKKPGGGKKILHKILPSCSSKTAGAKTNSRPGTKIATLSSTQDKKTGLGAAKSSSSSSRIATLDSIKLKKAAEEESAGTRKSTRCKGADLNYSEGFPIDFNRRKSSRDRFNGEIKQLFIYPPPPATRGIAVTNKDLFCLNQGEYLNDVIIDFYLKYLFTSVFPDDQERVHVFSSFFYKRLNQRDKGRILSQEEANMSLSERRHSRVRTWTRHVDLFSKDFIIIPINQGEHWYLAIICYPGLREPVYETATSQGKENEMSESSTTNPSSTLPGRSSTTNPSSTSPGRSTQEGHSASGSEDDTFVSRMIQNVKSKFTKQSPCAKVGKAAEKSKTENAVGKSVIKKRPCVLVLDSMLESPVNSVTKTLTEYLQVEWNLRKKATEGEMVLNKDTMRGTCPKCPRQNNDYDCGIYVLQYVESFIKAPIADYTLPIKSLKYWFPLHVVAGKREKIKELIQHLWSANS